MRECDELVSGSKTLIQKLRTLIASVVVASKMTRLRLMHTQQPDYDSALVVECSTVDAAHGLSCRLREKKTG